MHQRFKMASFLDNPELWNPKEKIWKKFSQIRYQNDHIELKFNCHYHSKGIYKPICLEIGQKTLYKSKKLVHQGYLSLNFTTMTVKNLDKQTIICLQYNSNILELMIDQVDQVQQLLARKCILTSFHENFLLEQRIGNMKSKVYEAIRKSTNERVAVKVYSKELISKLPQGRRSLKNQIKALRMMNSRHIIQLYEVHESETSIYLIMELLNGQELTDRMVNSLNPELNIPILMYNFIKALNQIHQKNIILRNIAPDNILFRSADSDDDLVIIDFGEIQINGKIIPKPRFATEYMAPELLENKIIDGKCDIYSVGVILYKLIVSEEFCQRFNFQAEQFLKAPKPLQSLIKKMLRGDPKIRYSAEKCLQHRCFKKFVNPQHLMVNIPRSNSISQQEKCSPISAKLLGSENLESESSKSSVSSQQIQVVSLRIIDEDKKQQVQQSRFSKFCSQMQEYQTPKINKKAQEESLLKLAVTNSYLKHEQKDGVLQTKQFRERIGFIKKSNSWNV